jgi:hypothetical protein
MAMYSGRATDAARVAMFRKTLAASAIDIGVFCMCTVAFCSGFLSNQESPALFQTSLVCSYCSLLVFFFFVLVFFATKTW